LELEKMGEEREQEEGDEEERKRSGERRGERRVSGLNERYAVRDYSRRTVSQESAIKRESSGSTGHRGCWRGGRALPFVRSEA
jgi:hypothetical protein